ncbi:MMPL family transporter [Actinacidiphila oryziradicis]|uniref:MMPL family transporter n=1 Tax=Actinacidiphila oryziradicis TaxID=2571141 RepID=UPI001B8026D3|nr:MMPL family transporter [Actinacidiphila oryziradicis]
MEIKRRLLLPWAVVGFWIAVVAVVLPFAGKLSGVTKDDQVSYLPASAQSTQVAKVQKSMPGGGSTNLVLVYHRGGGVTAADRKAEQRQVTAVLKKFEPANRNATPQAVLSADGTTLMVPVAVAQSAGDAKTVATAVRVIAAEGRPQGLTVLVGGESGLAADMDKVYNSIDGTLLLATVSVVAVLLVVTYRSPFLWLVPLVAVAMAAVAAMAVVYGLVQGFGLSVNSMSSSVMTILVFGAGTDYALLLVARYRDELHHAQLPYDAMRAALRRSGPAVLTSAGTVVAGLLCLLAADLNSSSALGPTGAVGVLCALAAMMTLLPAVLVLLGRRVFWPLIPAYGSEPKRRRGFYDRVGAAVVRRPVMVLVTGTVAVGALAFGALNLTGELRQEDSFVKKPESVSAMRILADSFPERGSQPITVLARTSRTNATLADVTNTKGVSAASTGRSAKGWTEISVTATAQPESPGETATINRLRTGLSEDGALVGGESAQTLDIAHTVSRDQSLVVPMVLTVVFILLAMLLRSLVAPLVLVTAMAGVWAAALGLGGLVFGPVFGFAGNDPALPQLSFVFLVALGVDYGIFLMHRMREEVLGGTPDREATVRALKATGGVIASAGIVLAATFSVLTVLPLVMMVELGSVIAAGVLLDTFVVRTFLVPAASVLLGHRIWWPSRLTGPVPAAPAPLGVVPEPTT